MLELYIAAYWNQNYFQNSKLLTTIDLTWEPGEEGAGMAWVLPCWPTPPLICAPRCDSSQWLVDILSLSCGYTRAWNPGPAVDRWRTAGIEFLSFKEVVSMRVTWFRHSFIQKCPRLQRLPRPCLRVDLCGLYSKAGVPNLWDQWLNSLK